MYISMYKCVHCCTGKAQSDSIKSALHKGENDECLHIPTTPTVALTNTLVQYHVPTVRGLIMIHSLTFTYMYVCRHGRMYVCMYVGACIWIVTPYLNQLSGTDIVEGRGGAHSHCTRHSGRSAIDGVDLLIPSILHTHRE